MKFFFQNCVLKAIEIKMFFNSTIIQIFLDLKTTKKKFFFSQSVIQCKSLDFFVTNHLKFNTFYSFNYWTEGKTKLFCFKNSLPKSREEVKTEKQIKNFFLIAIYLPQKN